MSLRPPLQPRPNSAVISVSGKIAVGLSTKVLAPTVAVEFETTDSVTSVVSQPESSLFVILLVVPYPVKLPVLLV